MRDLPAFEITYDYLCPFAHIVHEHLVAALQDGATWDVTFSPFTLRQVHKGDDAPDVWGDPERRDDLLSLAASVAVRDGWPDRFLDAHLALFRARHDRSMPLTSRDEVASVLRDAGLDADKVLEVVDAGEPYAELGRTFSRLVADYDVFGVPTFVADGDAVFVRLMARPTDAADARAAIEDVVTRLVEDRRLNEFKRTRIPR